MHHCVGDPDAADQERGETHQRQKLREPADIALELRRNAGARADFPACVREQIARLRVRVLQHRVAAVVEPHPVGPAHQAAGLHEPGRLQAFLRDDEPRPEADAGRNPVRLVLDRRGHDEGRVPDFDFAAGVDVEAKQERLFGDCAETLADALQGVRKRHIGIKLDPAVQRIAGVDRLHFD
jgi:hypothetical protein